MTDYDWFEAYRKEKAEIERLRAALGKKYREGYDNALAEQQVEIERLKYHYHALENAYKAIIEECARVAETFDCYCGQSGVHAARAIRALKDRP